MSAVGELGVDGVDKQRCCQSDQLRDNTFLGTFSTHESRASERKRPFALRRSRLNVGESRITIRSRRGLFEPQKTGATDSLTKNRLYPLEGSYGKRNKHAPFVPGIQLQRLQI